MAFKEFAGQLDGEPKAKFREFAGELDAAPAMPSVNPMGDVSPMLSPEESVTPMTAAPLSPQSQALQAATAEYERNNNFGQRIWNDLQRGYYNAKNIPSNLNMVFTQREINKIRSGEGQYGALIPEEREAAIANLENSLRESQKTAAGNVAKQMTIPRRPVLGAVEKAKTAGEAFELFKQDPFGAAGGAATESLPQILPALGIGAVTRNPVLGAAAMGGTSFASELGSGVFEYLDEKGINTSDTKAVDKALNDPKIFDEAFNFALKRAGIVATADTVAGGLASKSLIPKKIITAPVGREVANVAVAQPTAQAISGAGGEAAAQVATLGEVKYPGRPLLEAAGEAPGSVAETAAFGGSRIASELEPVIVPGRALGRAMQQDIDAREFDQGAIDQQVRESLSPDNAQLTYRPFDGELDSTTQTAAQSVAGAPIENDEERQAAPIDEPPAADIEPAADPAALDPIDAADPANVATQALDPVDPPAAPPTTAAESATTVTTATGRKINVDYELVEASELQAASGDLQPRDRSRDSSDIQIAQIAGQLDPARLAFSAEADRGAPIIGDDNIVESGNGRVRAIRRAYEQVPERAAAYKQFLVDSGFAAAANMQQPVLVRRRKTPLTPEERRQFVIESNQSATMSMSSTEKAMADADKMSSSVLQFLVSPDITAAANRDFVRAFTQSVIPSSEQNSMVTPDGGLSIDGKRRIEAALVAKAYNNADILVQLLESADVEAKSIGNAFLAAAPDFAKLRQDIADGFVLPEMDVTKELVEAAQLTSNLRSQGIKPEAYFQQQGMFGNTDPIVEQFVRGFYNNKGRAASTQQITDFLRFYVQQAETFRVGQENLFGEVETPQPVELVRGARERAEPPEQIQAPLLDQGDKNVEQTGEDRSIRRNDANSKQVQQRTTTQKRGESSGERGGKDVRDSGRDRQDQAKKDSDTKSKPEALKDDSSAQSSLRGQTKSGLVERVSFTNRQSIYRDAFAEAGIDPDVAENLPPANQFRILANLLQKTYGLALVQKTEAANTRIGIDQLLDAYRNMQFMAFALDLPSTAIGLNGSMGLMLRRSAQYLAAYYPGGTDNIEGSMTSIPTIVMPGRSNSFAHEWGHAFDYWLAGEYDKAGQSVSGMIRAEGASKSGLNDSMGSAFAKLMNAMFFDMSEQSARIFELERRLSITTSDKVRAELTKQLEDIREGASKALKDRSDFYKRVKNLGNDQYFLKPTEMLARSFEAYISYKVGAAGGTTEFIGKGTDAYQNDSDRYLSNAFPIEADRLNIFQAFDQLFDVVREKAILNQLGTPAALRPTDDNIVDPLQFYISPDNAQAPTLKGMLQDEKDNFRLDMAYARKLANRPADGKTRTQRYTDRVRDLAFSNRGVLFQIRRRYAGNARANKAMDAIIRRIATDPGRDSGATFAGGVFDEAVERNINQYGIRLANITKSFGLQEFTDAENAELRKALTALNDDEVTSLDPKIAKPAAALRRLMNDTFYYLRDAGVDVGYIVDQGYLPRIQDEAAIFADQPGFVKDATRLYSFMFDDEVKQFQDTDATDFPAIAKEMVNRYNKVIRLKKAQDQATLPKFTKALEFKEFREVMAKINEFLSKIAAAEKEGENDKVDNLNAELAQYTEENLETLAEARDLVRDLWSDAAAHEWSFRTMHGKFNSWESNSPTGFFLKRRELPPEADRIMAKWYLQDPVETVQTYLQGAIKKAEYNRRFGVNQLRKNDPAFISLEKLLEELTRANIVQDDVNQVESIVKQVTGQMPSQIPSGARWLLNTAQGLGTIVLLGRVALTSIAEPIAVSIQTGNSLDAFKSIAYTLQEILPTSGIRERRVLSDILGINGSLDWSDIVSNRMGGVFEGDPKLDRVTNKFFRRVGLTGLTRAQRRTSMAIGIRYFAELGKDIMDKTDNARFARDELVDFGVQPNLVDEFAEYIAQFTERMPSPEEIQGTPLGAELSVAIGRLVNQSIQNPKIIDRPWAANTTVGRMTYGLLSFNMAFYRNAMAKSFLKIAREAEAGGKKRAAYVAFSQVAAPFAALYFGHLLVTIAREAMLNPDKLEDERKKGRLEAYLLTLALSRSGFTGLLDVPLNAFTSVKYERDIANIFVGATAAFIGSSIEKITKFFVKNSDKTNSAEFNGIKGMYELLAQPMLAYATGTLPGGAIVGAGYGMANAYLSSPAFKNDFAEFWVGKKDDRKKKGATGIGDAP